MNQKSRVIVSDIDECIFDSVSRHYQWLTAHGEQNGWDNLPSFEQVLEAGGSHGVYGHYHGYKELNTKMLEDSVFNSQMNAIVGSKPALDALAPHLSLYLTTRPDCIADLTRQELLAYSFPDRVVWARPSSVPLEHTAQWKFQKLVELAEYLNSTVVLIDDSVNTHQYIQQAAHPLVEPILFAGAATSKTASALTWPQIVDLFSQS